MYAYDNTLVHLHAMTNIIKQCNSFRYGNKHHESLYYIIIYYVHRVYIISLISLDLRTRVQQ